MYLNSGRWVRTDVRRYPQGVCPSCGHCGALRRNPGVDPDQPDGWLTRRHFRPEENTRCESAGAVVRPVVMPEGWLD